MRGNFTTYVNQNSLIDLKWDKTNIKEAMTEIIELFNQQQIMIIQMKENLNNYVTKSDLEEQIEENNRLKLEFEDFKSNISSKVDELDNNTKKSIDDLREWTDTSNSSVLVDVRRYLSTELKSQIEEALNEQPEKEVTVIERSVPKSEDNRYISGDNYAEKQIFNIKKQIEELETIVNGMPTYKFIQSNLSEIHDKLNYLASVQENLQGLGSRINELDVKITTAPRPSSAQQKETTQQPEQKIPIPQENSIPNPPKPVFKPYVPSQQLDRTPNISIFTTDTSSSKLKLNLDDLEIKETKKIAPLNFAALNDDEVANNQRAIRRVFENLSNLKLTVDKLIEQVNSLTDSQAEASAKYLTRFNKMMQDIDRLQEMTSPRTQEAKFRGLDERFKGIEEKLKKVEGEQYRQRMQYVMRSSFEAEPIKEKESPKTAEKEEDELPPPPEQGKRSHFESPVESPKETPREALPHQAPQNAPRTPSTIKIIRTSDRQRNELMQALAEASAGGAGMTQEEIQEKVDNAIRTSLAGFSERVRREAMKEVEKGLKEVDRVRALIETKIDRDFVDRMFNKFRVLVLELKEKVDSISTTFMGWVTREEMEEVLERFAQSLAEVKDTAGGSSKFRCLLCGRPRTHIAGMMVNSARSEEEDAVESQPRPIKSRAKSRITTPASPTRKPMKSMPRDVVQFLTLK